MRDQEPAGHDDDLATRRAQLRCELVRDGVAHIADDLIAYLDDRGFEYPDGRRYTLQDSKLLGEATIVCTERFLEANAPPDSVIVGLPVLGDDEIEFEDAAFGPRPDGGSYGTVAVKSEDLGATASAMDRSGERLGVEHDAAEVEGPASVHYMPNYVGPSVIGDDAVTLHVDCKGDIPAPMRGAFLAIIREELRWHGIARATVGAAGLED